MDIKESALFFKGALKNIHAVGSIMPSSKAVAKTMTAALRQSQQPRKILEVGAGTGPITARIVKDMGPQDTLDIYEIDPKFTRFLEKRFASESDFIKVRDRVTIYTKGIEAITREPQYDVIISAVPFTNMPPDLVRNFFETFRDVLNPGGTFTYIEFAFGRAIFRVFAKKEAKQRLSAVGNVVDHYRETYQVKHKFVPLNMPPARIRTLKFH